jgi:hypothetical protein
LNARENITFGQAAPGLFLTGIYINNIHYGVLRNIGFASYEELQAKVKTGHFAGELFFQASFEETRQASKERR